MFDLSFRYSVVILNKEYGNVWISNVLVFSTFSEYGRDLLGHLNFGKEV